MRPPVLLFAKPKTARTPNVALGRVRSLVVQVQNQNGPIKSFAVLSANRRRGGYRTKEAPGELVSQETNDANNAELELALRTFGFGYTKQRGLWMEASDVEGQPKTQVDEPSYFVPGLPFKLAVKLFERYSQDGILYAGPETQGKVVFIGFSRWAKPVHGKEFAPRSPEVFEVGDFKTILNQPKDVQDSYENQSKVQGRPYVFGSLRAGAHTLPPLLRPR